MNLKSGFTVDVCPYVDEIPEAFRLHLNIYDIKTLMVIQEAYKTFDSPGYKCSKNLRRTLNYQGYLVRGNNTESSIIFINSLGEGELVVLPHDAPHDDDNEMRPSFSLKDVKPELINILKTYVQMFPINYETIFKGSTKIPRIKATLKHLQNEPLTPQEVEFIGAPLDPFAQSSFKEFMSKFIGWANGISPSERMTKQLVEFLHKARGEA